MKIKLITKTQKKDRGKQKMNIYISGPITGNPNYKEQFAVVADKLRGEGHQVLDPTVWTKEGLKLNYEDYMILDLAMVDVADAIFMLQGWQNSAGAKRELQRAKEAGKTVLNL